MKINRTLATLLTVALGACSRGEAESTPEAQRQVPVEVAWVQFDSVHVPLIGTGMLAPGEEVTLSFKTGGIIRDVMVNPGDRVEAGQILAILDLREIDAGVSQARSAAAKAERDLVRARRLYADSVIPLAQLQDAETTWEILSADLDRGEFNRRHALISSPSAGVVLRRFAEPGEFATPGIQILTLGSSRRGNVLRIGLPDRDAIRVDRGDPATVQFDAIPGMTYTGAVTEVGVDAESTTGTYSVEISLEDASDLASGLVGTASISPDDRIPAVIIPISALLEANDHTGFVFVVREDATVERRRVVVGPVMDDRLAITRGLALGEVVVTTGAAYLRDGDEVEVVS